MKKLRTGTGFWSKLSLLLAVTQLMFSVYHEIKATRPKIQKK